MSGPGGHGQAAPVGEAPRPENVVERSVRAFLVAPLIQNVVLWIVVAVTMLVSTNSAVRFSFSTGFWWFAAGALIVSYLIAATLGVIVHVICVKLGLWRFWHYVLAGLLGGLIPAALWGLTVSPEWAFARVVAMGTYTVPSALVIAIVVWLMVFWRNPPARSMANVDAFS
jgi:hypothetical protein